MSGKDGGYILPLVIDPPRFSICIEIPDDIYHIAAFWGALDQLTWSKNWQRDPDHKAAVVARIWETLLNEAAARMNAGEECMPIDPCCPTDTELLEQIKVLNQTIVNNQLTLISNNETIINQNTQVTANQYLTQYQSFVTNNQTVNQFNEMVYDGTPQSIAPELGEDFGGAGAGDAALCAAIKSYINSLVYVFGMQAAALSGIATVIVGIGLALAPLTLGTSLLGVAVVGAIQASAALWNAVVNDPEAQRKVACCMFDALKDQPISQATFQTSCDGCGFGGTYDSNEAFLAAQIAGVNQLDENWLAFVRALGQSQGGGNASECVCDCEDDLILVDYEGWGCPITPMGNCIYKFTQETIFPAESVWRNFSVKDELDRCLFFEESPDPSMPTTAVGTGTRVIDCDDVESTFPGGFTPGEAKRVAWRIGHVGVTYIKITLAPE